MFNLPLSDAELRLAHITTPDGADIKYRHHVMNRLPEHFNDALATQYLNIFSDKSKCDANLFLLGVKEKMTNQSIRLGSSDDALKLFAKRRSKEALRFKSLNNAEASYKSLCLFVLAHDIEPLEVGKQYSLNGAINRMCCEKWWRSAVRRHHAREFEACAIDAGFVHQKAGLYVSDQTMARRIEQRKQMRSLLSQIIAENELGQVYTLAELQDLGVGSPENRRNELMARIDGSEKVALKRGLVAGLYTITCPSRMHARYYRSGDENQNYDQTTPRQANQYLGKVWTRIRAKLGRLGISVYGFIVTEPMHDGTPHKHFLLFIHKEHRKTVRKIFSDYALQDSGDEPGAKERRFTYVEIDSSKGRATSYISKYISKNIDGHGLDEDLNGVDAATSAQRVEAWASTWGIRQFASVGNPSVTIWRELRKMNEPESQDLLPFWEAAKQGDWEAYVELMGGPGIKKEDRPLQQVTEFIDQPGIYGDAQGRKAIGPMLNGEFIPYEKHQWTLSMKEDENRLKPVIRLVPDDFLEPVTELLDKNIFEILQGAETGSGPVPGSSDPEAPRHRIIATITQKGEEITGIPEGTILHWHKAKSLPEGDPGEPLVTWKLIRS